MAKAKKKIRRRKKFTLPLAVVGPIAGNLLTRQWPAIKDGNLTLAGKRLASDYAGVNLDTGSFTMDGLKNGAIPLLFGVLVHKGASKLGVNRALAGAGVPWIRI